MNRRSLLAGGAAVFGVSTLPAAAQTSAIRIALAANDAAAEPFYAKELGFFAGAGIDANIMVMANGGASVSGLVAGAIDVAATNVVSAVTAFKKGLPLKIVAGASVYDGTVPQNAILVPKSSSIKTAKDLEGKTVATNPIRGIGDLATNSWMLKRGADPSTVKWIEMPLAEMGTAMAQGRIDAATVTEPFIALNRSTTRMIGAPYSAIAPRFITVAWITSDQWGTAHPELVQRFAAVMRQTAIWANKNQARSGAILAANSKLNQQIVSEMGRVKYAERFTAAEIQPNIDLAARYKLIDAAFPAQDMIYQPPR